jgi:hypothetical protein
VRPVVAATAVLVGVALLAVRGFAARQPTRRQPAEALVPADAP